jgi:hypothetical protein
VVEYKDPEALGIVLQKQLKAAIERDFPLLDEAYQM